MSLTTLAATHGKTLAELALLGGVDPLLFDNVERGRQPMPMVVARRIAESLAVHVSAVVSECPFATSMNFSLLTRARYLSPIERTEQVPASKFAIEPEVVVELADTAPAAAAAATVSFVI